jgi:hypothetical protein
MFSLLTVNRSRPRSSRRIRLGLSHETIFDLWVARARGHLPEHDLTTRTVARWWWPQPSIYVVVLVPFLFTALIDRALKDARAWERLIVAGITAFVASGLACALVYRGLGAWGVRVLRGAPCRCMLVAGHSDGRRREYSD